MEGIKIWMSSLRLHESRACTVRNAVWDSVRQKIMTLFRRGSSFWTAQARSTCRTLIAALCGVARWNSFDSLRQRNVKHYACAYWSLYDTKVSVYTSPTRTNKPKWTIISEHVWTSFWSLTIIDSRFLSFCLWLSCMRARCFVFAEWWRCCLLLRMENSGQFENCSKHHQPPWTFSYLHVCLRLLAVVCCLRPFLFGFVCVCVKRDPTARH